MLDKFVIIDGSSIFYRSFYALPLLSNSQGEYSNAVYGFAIQIQNIIQNIKPKYLAVAFDASKHTFRNDMFDGYKATRKPMPSELRSQIEPLKEMFRLMNISLIEKQGIEGDDVIGILSRKFEGVQNIIVTGDRDTFQLVNENTSVYFTKHGTSELKIITPSTLKEEYGVDEKQFIDLKALQGDSSDNIPGVAGVGPKTATDLIQKYGNLDGIYANLSKISGKVKERLENDKDVAYLSKKLATILTEGDLDVELENLKFDFPFSKNVYDFFKHYEFRTLLKNQSNFNFDEEVLENKNIEINIEKLDNLSQFNKILNLIDKEKKFALALFSDEFHLSVGTGEIIFKTSFNLLGDGINEFEFFNKFKQVFEDESVLKICFDAKQIMYKLKEYKINLVNYFDISVAKYLVDGVPVDKTSDVFDENQLPVLASQMIEAEKELSKKIFEENLQFLFNNVEIPLVKVLFSMENAGFKVDLDVLNDLKNKYEIELKNLEKEIYFQAGVKFNINSPKQLGEVLFDKLGLSHKKKKSTSAEELETIKGEHKIVEFILRYRKVAKFLSTYLIGLSSHIDSAGFIHTYFKQTFTTTGRLSSIEPNLQNIPIRSDESREIRSMFIASNENNVLIDADYSQIELRLLAHMSGDKVFVNSFSTGADIHKETAATVFGCKASEVTPEMRRTAKVVNFGIIYGISEYGLADDLKIKPYEARNLISNFYLHHPAVKIFMENSIQKAKDTGKATTLFGRTRKMFDINASNYMVRTRAERASQNMPLQGTAADIIKIAMVGVFRALENAGLKAKLIMQVHDELIIDCPKDEENAVRNILKQEMENAAKLIVPLEVDIQSSYRWSDGH
ncbi:MAG: DNA polymerase I [Clostridia bacterium]|nr:DNA polymerase I [Clostridia bacterium]